MNVHPLRSGAGIVLGNNPLDSTSRRRRSRAAANGVVLHPLPLTELGVLRGRHGIRRRDAGDVIDIESAVVMRQWRCEAGAVSKVRRGYDGFESGRE